MPETPPTQYDVIIIGGACAGLAAGTYAGRRAMKTLIITKDIGGQISTTPDVENYPGIDFITGPDLGNAMMEQAIKWGSELVYDEVTTIEKRGEKDFVITTPKENYYAKSIILAYGKTPRNLGVPGELEFAGKGVSYCVTCDAPLYRGRTVVVVGGGSSAMEGALILSKICEKVYIVHRREEFRGEDILLQQINATPNIEKVLSSVSEEVVGEQVVKGLKVKHMVSGESRTLEVSGVFVEIGFIVNSALVKDLVELDRLNQIIADNSQKTSNPGVFAAGDITDTPFKQAVISASEGAKAALTAYSYVNDGKPVGVDWSTH